MDIALGIGIGAVLVLLGVVVKRYTVSVDEKIEQATSNSLKNYYSLLNKIYALRGEHGRAIKSLKDREAGKKEELEGEAG